MINHTKWLLTVKQTLANKW